MANPSLYPLQPHSPSLPPPSFPPPEVVAANAARPTMRRKSSAQNLLSSFKTVQSAVHAQPGPSPIMTAGPSIQGAGISYTSPTASNGPSSIVSSRQHDWDVQSMSTHSDSTTLVGSTGISTQGTSTAGSVQGTSVEYLRDIVQKRIITLTYMRNVHEGRSHWFHTIMMTKADLDRVFNNNAMKKRTYRFAILGMSLSNLLDIHQPQDLLRGMLNTLTEYEQWKEESEKPKMRLFKSRTGKRQAVGGFTDFSMTYADASETSYLFTPHIPFPLDYRQTLLSLLDILSECYNKIARILGPSPFPHSGQHMAGPLGLLSPHPGVSYLFSDQQQHGQAGDGTLYGIAHAGMGAMSIGGGASGGLGSPPPSWTPSIGESVLKIDGKLKKITNTLLKELDTFARNGIKDELASLDPLLRNVSAADDGREQFDFEGSV